MGSLESSFLSSHFCFLPLNYFILEWKHIYQRRLAWGHPFRYSLQGFHSDSKYFLKPACLLPPPSSTLKQWFLKVIFYPPAPILQCRKGFLIWFAIISEGSSHFSLPHICNFVQIWEFSWCYFFKSFKPWGPGVRGLPYFSHNFWVIHWKEATCAPASGNRAVWDRLATPASVG